MAANPEHVRRATTDEQEVAIEKMLAIVNQMAVTAGTRAQDFLTLTNGSAAIACLALIGSESPYAKSSIVRVLLAMFVVGLGLAGVTMVRGFRFATGLAWDF